MASEPVDAAPNKAVAADRDTQRVSAVIDVPEISVQVVTGEAAQDPYGQGFAAISAAFEVVDRALIERVVHIAGQGTSVKVRCAMISVSGPITRTERIGQAMRFVLMVDDLIYRKPSGPRISRRSKKRSG
jgi:hypothetical protein